MRFLLWHRENRYHARCRDCDATFDSGRRELRDRWAKRHVCPPKGEEAA